MDEAPYEDCQRRGDAPTERGQDDGVCCVREECVYSSEVEMLYRESVLERCDAVDHEA